MKKQKANKASQQAKATEEPGLPKIITDPNGSYTGRAEDPMEKPVQDADDL